MADSENKTDKSGSNAQPQPGTVITPGAAEVPPEPAPSLPETPQHPDVQSQPPETEPSSAPSDPTLPLSSSEAEPATAAPRQEYSVVPTGLTPDDDSGGDGQGFSWTASEFIHHNKSASWYSSLAAGALILAVIIFLFTRDIVSVAVIIVAALILGTYGARRPRQLEYNLDQSGLNIGGKYHSYDEFKSFSIVPEGDFSSIEFMPLKRFSPATTIYYSSQDEESIVTLLSNHLPFEEPRRDAVDSLMRRIRF